MKFEFTNLDVVLNELDKKISDEALKRNVGQACAIVEREAKTKAPKDTGALRRSIQSTTKKEDGQKDTGQQRFLLHPEQSAVSH